MKIEKTVVKKYEIVVEPTSLVMTFDNWAAEGAWQVFKVGDTVAIGGCVYEVCKVETQYAPHTNENAGESKAVVFLRAVKSEG